MTRGETGRASAGPRPQRRALNRDEVLARQAHWMAQPASSDRNAALKTCRSQLASINNRVEK